MAGKWLELLKEIAPHLERAAFLYNPATAPFAETYLDSFKTAAEESRGPADHFSASDVAGYRVGGRGELAASRTAASS